MVEVSIKVHKKSTEGFHNSEQRIVSDNQRMLRLYEAAEVIFLQKGYHTATMTDVAKAAKMSKKTVYTLISSKAELFAGLLAHQQSRLIFPDPEPSWTTREILSANLICLGRFLLAPEQIAIIRLIMAEYTHSPDLGRVFHRNQITKAKSRLESCLVDLAITRGCGPHATKDLASMLFGMAIGEFHLGALVGFRSPPTKQVLEKRVIEAVNIFLAGCATT